MNSLLTTCAGVAAVVLGTLSVVQWRAFRLDRCRYHGRDGLERWVGWGIIAHDLRTISQRTARPAQAVA